NPFPRTRLLYVEWLAAEGGAHPAGAEDLVEPVVADVVTEPRDVLFFDEDGGVVQAEALAIVKTREAAGTDLHALLAFVTCRTSIGRTATGTDCRSDSARPAA